MILFSSHFPSTFKILLLSRLSRFSFFLLCPFSLNVFSHYHLDYHASLSFLFSRIFITVLFHYHRGYYDFLFFLLLSSFFICFLLLLSSRLSRLSFFFFHCLFLCILFCIIEVNTHHFLYIFFTFSKLFYLIIVKVIAFCFFSFVTLFFLNILVLFPSSSLSCISFFHFCHLFQLFFFIFTKIIPYELPNPLFIFSGATIYNL